MAGKEQLHRRLRPHRARIPRHDLSDRHREPHLALLDQATQIAIGEHAHQLAVRIHDGAGARTPRRLGHDRDRPGERRRLANERVRGARAHDLAHLHEPAPELSAGVVERVLLAVERAVLEHRHGERIAEGEEGGGGGGGGEAHGTGLLDGADADGEVRAARERVRLIPSEGHHPRADPLQRRQEPQDLLRLARVRERQHQVLARDAAEIPVRRLGRVEVVGGRAGGGQRRADLLRHEAGLADPGDHHSSAATQDPLHGGREARVEDEAAQRRRLRLDDGRAVVDKLAREAPRSGVAAGELHDAGGLPARHVSPIYHTPARRTAHSRPWRVLLELLLGGRALLRRIGALRYTRAS